MRPHARGSTRSGYIVRARRSGQLGVLVVRPVRARLHYHLWWPASERKVACVGWPVSGCGARCRHGMVGSEAGSCSPATCACCSVVRSAEHEGQRECCETDGSMRAVWPWYREQGQGRQKEVTATNVGERDAALMQRW